MKQYLWNVFSGLSFFINSLGGGSPYETFCSTQYRRKKAGKINIVRALDFFIGKDHCLICHVNTQIRKEVGYKND